MRKQTTHGKNVFSPPPSSSSFVIRSLFLFGGESERRRSAVGSALWLTPRRFPVNAQSYDRTVTACPSRRSFVRGNAGRSLCLCVGEWVTRS